MIEGGKNEETVTTDGDFTGIERQVDGVGFRLVPVSRTAKFPVHVVVDNNSADPVVVNGPGWHSQGLLFHSLKVDVTPGGGEDGHKWQLFIRPTESDAEDQRLAVDDKGQVLTHTGEPVLLMTVGESVGGEHQDGTYYLPSLEASDELSNAEGDWVDISAYRLVKLSVWMDNGLAGYVDETLAVFLEVTDAPEGEPVRNIPMGSVNNLGSGSPKMGHIMVGETTDAEGALEKREGARYRYARAKFQVGNGPLEFDGFFFVQLWGFP